MSRFTASLTLQFSDNEHLQLNDRMKHKANYTSNTILYSTVCFLQDSSQEVVMSLSKL